MGTGAKSSGVVTTPRPGVGGTYGNHKKHSTLKGPVAEGPHRPTWTFLPNLPPISGWDFPVADPSRQPEGRAARTWSMLVDPPDGECGRTGQRRHRAGLGGQREKTHHRRQVDGSPRAGKPRPCLPGRTSRKAPTLSESYFFLFEM